MHVHLPIYHAGEKVGPGNRPPPSEVEVPETTQAYNINTHQTDDILDNNIGYLPTINTPATNMSTVNKVLSQSKHNACIKT